MVQVDYYEPQTLLGNLNATEQKGAPEKLYAAGDVGLLRCSPRVSVIGSRDASTEGLQKAEIVARAIVDRKGVVISGLALGVDTAAHRGAIAAGGRTCAVLGTPLDKCYPKENATLQQQLAEKHLIITQFPIGYPVMGNNFVMRNRTMALLSQASIIIEAGAKSGTEHQGWEAIRLGRLLLLPRKLVDASFDWPRKMCEYGALVFENRAELETLLDDDLPALAAEQISEFPF